MKDSFPVVTGTVLHFLWTGLYRCQ